jgi:hypothetical protein
MSLGASFVDWCEACRGCVAPADPCETRASTSSRGFESRPVRSTPEQTWNRTRSYKMLSRCDDAVHGRDNAWGPLCMAMGLGVLRSVQERRSIRRSVIRKRRSNRIAHSAAMAST